MELFLGDRLLILVLFLTKASFNGRGTEQVKTGQVNLDHLSGHFRGRFRGHLRGTFVGAFMGSP